MYMQNQNMNQGQPQPQNHNQWQPQQNMNYTQQAYNQPPQQQYQQTPRTWIQGKMIGVKVFPAVMRDGRKQDNFSYTFDAGQNFKYEMSSFHNHIDMFLMVCDVEYTEKPNERKPLFPYRNITTITLAANPNMTTQQIRQSNVFQQNPPQTIQHMSHYTPQPQQQPIRNLLANPDLLQPEVAPVLSQQMQEQGIPKIEITDAEKGILDKLKVLGKGQVSFNDFIITLTDSLNITEERANDIWNQYWN